jgi:A/G-specific adenine glycosylase
MVDSPSISNDLSLAVERATKERLAIIRRLRKWSVEHRRKFPWRESGDPYLVLLAEVMLQRTQAAQVAGNFARLVQAFPSVESLAAVPLRELSDAMSPLGLAKRAGTLHRMAEQIVERHDGRIPTSYSELSKLSGVGRYIASATLCFAFRQQVAIVDANVIRVFSRYFGFVPTGPKPRDDERLWQIATILLPRGGAGEFNYTLLDLAAITCTSRHPRCTDCPLAVRCSYWLVGPGR